MIKFTYYRKQLLKDDTELIRACLAENQSAQNTLYNRFAPKMLGVCYRYAQTIAEAEDVLQEGFIKVFNNLSAFRSESSLETWITRIMVNTSLNHLRSSKKFKMEGDLELLETNPEEVSFQFHTMDAALVMKCVQELPTGYRIVLNMFAIEGYSHAEIAASLGIKESSSRSQYLRAKALLEKRLNGLMEIPLSHYG
ncbi:MAG: RNA polymerase sigma factor, partial [Bacteroidota bacterium]